MLWLKKNPTVFDRRMLVFVIFINMALVVLETLLNKIIILTMIFLPLFIWEFELEDFIKDRLLDSLYEQEFLIFFLFFIGNENRDSTMLSTGTGARGEKGNRRDIRKERER